MAKYIITKDISFFTYVPKLSGMPSQKVNFKKGDILEGNLIKNENKGAMQSDAEAPQFFETQTAKGKVRIPYGFRGVPLIEAMSTNSIPETIIGNEPKPKVNPKTNEATETKWFTTKNIVIGVLVIVGIYVFLKWKKMI